MSRLAWQPKPVPSGPAAHHPLLSQLPSPSPARSLSLVATGDDWAPSAAAALYQVPRSPASGTSPVTSTHHHQRPEGHFLVWRDSTPLSYTITIPVNKMTCKSALSFMRDQAKVGALKRLTLSSSKTAGRNSSGRITSYHRGGGAKRLQRKVDVKRGTNACQVGNCIPLANARIGTWVHDIECRPGQGGKMVRAAGTYAKVVQEPGAQCVLRLPSGAEKIVDSKCRATIGIVSNPSHGTRKLRKAGHSRWLGRRPIVRGVAMNPVDHPHGGGEGRTKGGRPSVSPWGKPTKAGVPVTKCGQP